MDNSNSRPLSDGDRPSADFKEAPSELRRSDLASPPPPPPPSGGSKRSLTPLDVPDRMDGLHLPSRRSMQLDISALASPKRRIKSVLSPFHAQSPAKQDQKAFFPPDAAGESGARNRQRGSELVQSPQRSPTASPSLSSEQRSSSLSEDRLTDPPPLYDWSSSGSITPLHAAVSFGYPHPLPLLLPLPFLGSNKVACS